MTAKSSLIFKQISAVMSDVTAIGKTRNNKMQGYQFRGIDDVYNELHSILAKHSVFTVPEVISERSEDRQTKSGGSLIYRILQVKYHFFAEDGSSVTATVVGEGMDSGDKASNKAMAVAHKYALMQVLCIPTEEPKDPENDSHDTEPKEDPPAPTMEDQTYMAHDHQKRYLIDLLKRQGIYSTAEHVKAHQYIVTEEKKLKMSDLEDFISKLKGIGVFGGDANK